MRDEEKDLEIVTASEIASWAWCPESWRLESLGHDPSNRAALRRGESFHSRLGLFERVTGFALTIGGCLLAAAVLLTVLIFTLGKR